MTRDDTLDRLLDAALMHVAFDGWSDATFAAAVDSSGLDMALARSLCPRRSLDLALAYHRRGDRQMQAHLAELDLAGMRIRERIKSAVVARIEAAEDKEAVRRGVTLFSLPQYAPDGAKAIWSTCDLIWTTIGDTSTDGNWYSKRAILSGVYTSTVLYWLGDDSLDHQATWDFLDRRIEDVMRIEKLKAQVQDNPLLKPFAAGPNWLMSRIKAPSGRDDLPGSI